MKSKETFSLEPGVTHLLEDLWRDYLKIYKFAKHQKFIEDEEEKILFTDRLIKNESVPKVIPLVSNNPAPIEYIKYHIDTELKTYETAKNFLNEMKECLSQEYNCTQMQPNRVKDENRITCKKVKSKDEKSTSSKSKRQEKLNKVKEEPKNSSKESLKRNPKRKERFKTPAKESKRFSSISTCTTRASLKGTIEKSKRVSVATSNFNSEEITDNLSPEYNETNDEVDSQDWEKEAYYIGKEDLEEEKHQGLRRRNIENDVDKIAFYQNHKNPTYG